MISSVLNPEHQTKLETKFMKEHLIPSRSHPEERRKENAVKKRDFLPPAGFAAMKKCAVAREFKRTMHYAGMVDASV